MHLLVVNCTAWFCNAVVNIIVLGYNLPGTSIIIIIIIIIITIIVEMAFSYH
jgi:hypothetical protein